MRPMPLLLLTTLLASLACAGEPTASSAAPGAAAPAAKGAAKAFEWVDASPGKGALAEQLAGAASSAKAAGKQPIAYLHASWCGPCAAIDKTIGEPKMSAAFAGTWVLRIDVDQYAAELDAAGLDSGTIPAFFKLDAAGKPTGAKIDGGAWGDNIPENMAPPLGAFFAGG